MRRVISNCQRMKPALRSLRTKLGRKELLQVITSHYYLRLYYGSEIWDHPLQSKYKDCLSPLHFYPLRLVLRDFKKVISNKKVLSLTDRASPSQFNNFKIAKLVITIVNNTDPFVLFHELLSHAVIERRSPRKPWFLDMSRSRTGRQSLANRVSPTMRKINFDWLDVDLSKDSLRRMLKMCFFH